MKTVSRALLASTSLLLVAVLLLGNAGTSAANVPTILQIVNVSHDGEGNIRLQITHSNPSPSHYVNMAEVQVGGKTTQFPLGPQTTDPFTINLDLGPLQGTPDVRARVNCNLHGWSDWSQSIPIPEFPTVAIVGFTLLVAMVMFRRAILLGENMKKV